MERNKNDFHKNSLSGKNIQVGFLSFNTSHIIGKGAFS